MEVQVLGPVALIGGPAREARLPGRKHRALLARLAAVAPHSVSASDLIDAIWGEQLPADPVHSLQHLVWGLRSSAPGGDEAVLRTHGGYRLDPSVWPVDAQAFMAEVTAAESALVDGDAGTAHGLLSRALERWQGVPFGEFCDEADLAPERECLDELALRARETHAEALFELGRDAEAAALVRWLAVRAPQRARVRGLARRTSHAGRVPAPAARAEPLSRVEHELATRLSVFEGSFGLVDAEEVCADRELPARELRNAFAGLVVAGVVERARPGFALAGGPGLRAPGRIRAAHARWVTGMTPAVRGSGGVEHVADAVAALRHASLTHDARLAASIMVAVGRAFDAAAAPHDLVPLLDVLDGQGEQTEAALGSRLWAAHFAAACGDDQRVDQHLRVAVTIAGEGGPSARGRAAAVASVLARQRRSPAAAALAGRAVALLATAAPHEQAYALSVASPAQLAAGHSREAAQLARRAADRYEQLGDRQGMTWAMTSWAQAEAAWGAHRSASRRAREAVAIATDLDDDSSVARALEAAADADARAGEVEAALRCLAAASLIDERRAGATGRDLRRVTSRAARVRRRLDEQTARAAYARGIAAVEAPAALLAL